MNNKDKTTVGDEAFVMPKVEIILFETEDVVTTSRGAFYGDWDVDLPMIDF